MDKDTLILKNGTVIELEAGASLGSMAVVTPDRMSMVKVWAEMTEENLSEVQIKNGSGIVAGRYTGLVLVSETSVVQEDGTIRTSFNLREKTEIEKRMDAVEDSIRVHDGAIMDMAEAVSTMAEA